jgi:hypothetical protein
LINFPALQPFDESKSRQGIGNFLIENLKTNLKTPPPIPKINNINNNNSQSTDVNALSNSLANNGLSETIISPNPTNGEEKLLPQQCVPKPTNKMKQVIWSKIHPNRIIGQQNMWTKFKCEHENQKIIDRNGLVEENSNYFHEIEEYFKLNEIVPKSEVELAKEANFKETKSWHNHEKVPYKCFFFKFYKKFVSKNCFFLDQLIGQQKELEYQHLFEAI